MFYSICVCSLPNMRIILIFFHLVRWSLVLTVVSVCVFCYLCIFFISMLVHLQLHHSLMYMSRIDYICVYVGTRYSVWCNLPSTFVSACFNMSGTICEHHLFYYQYSIIKLCCRFSETVVLLILQYLSYYCYRKTSSCNNYKWLNLIFNTKIGAKYNKCMLTNAGHMRGTKCNVQIL